MNLATMWPLFPWIIIIFSSSFFLPCINEYSMHSGSKHEECAWTCWGLSFSGLVNRRSVGRRTFVMLATVGVGSTIMPGHGLHLGSGEQPVLKETWSEEKHSSDLSARWGASLLRGTWPHLQVTPCLLRGHIFSSRSLCLREPYLEGRESSISEGLDAYFIDRFLFSFFNQDLCLSYGQACLLVPFSMGNRVD